MIKAATLVPTRKAPDAVGGRARSLMAVRASLQESVLKESCANWRGELRDEEGNLRPRQIISQERNTMETFTLKSNSFRNRIASFSGFGGPDFHVAFDSDGLAQVPVCHRTAIERYMVLKPGRLSIIEDQVEPQVEVASDDPAPAEAEKAVVEEEVLAPQEEEVEEPVKVKTVRKGRGKTAKKE